MKTFIRGIERPSGRHIEIDKNDFDVSKFINKQSLPGFAWCFYTDAQEDTDPGGTYFGFDSSDFRTVTRIYVDDEDTDTSFPGEPNKISHNVSEWLRYIGEDGGYLTLFDTGNAKRWLIYRILPEGEHAPTYEKLHVEYIAHNDTEVQNEIDVLTVSGAASGTFTLSATTDSNGQTTLSPLSFDASKSDIESEFDASGISVLVTGEDLVTGLTIEFIGRFSSQSVVLAVDDNSTDGSVDISQNQVGNSGPWEINYEGFLSFGSDNVVMFSYSEKISDMFSEAQEIYGLEGSIGPLSTHGWTIENNEPDAQNAPFSSGPGRSTWFIWTAPEDIRIEFNTGGSYDSDGTIDQLDTVIAVWTGEKLNELTEIISNDSANDQPPNSYVEFIATRGSRYLIQVGTYYDVSALLRLVWRPASGLTITKDDGDVTVEAVRKIVFSGDEVMVSKSSLGEANIEIVPAGITAVTSLTEPASLKTNIIRPQSSTLITSWGENRDLKFMAGSLLFGTPGDGLYPAILVEDSGYWTWQLYKTGNDYQILFMPPLHSIGGDTANDLVAFAETNPVAGYSNIGGTRYLNDYMTVELAPGSDGSGSLTTNFNFSALTEHLTGGTDVGNNDLIFTEKVINSGITIEYVNSMDDSGDTTVSILDQLITVLLGCSPVVQAKVSTALGGNKDVMFEASGTGHDGIAGNGQEIQLWQEDSNGFFPGFDIDGFAYIRQGGNTQILVKTGKSANELVAWAATNPAANSGSNSGSGDPSSLHDYITISLASGSDGTGTYSPLDPIYFALSGGAPRAIIAIANDVLAAIADNVDSDALVFVDHAPGNDGTGLVTTMSAMVLTSPTLTGDISFVSDTLKITTEGNIIRIEIPT